MADYEPPEADSDDDDSDDGKAKGKSAKKPKAKKDPNAPKVSFHSCLVCDIMLFLILTHIFNICNTSHRNQ